MRFVLAISALVLAGIMLILGIGQTTFFAGPRMISHSTELSNEHGQVVIPAEAFDAVAGQANVSVTGVDPFIAVGHERDVQAWVAPFGHDTISLDTEQNELVSTPVRADAEAAEAYATLVEADEDEELAPPPPIDSDLWLEQRTIDQNGTVVEEENQEQANLASTSNMVSVRMPVNLKPTQAVFVTVAEPGTSAKVALEWIQDRRAPWAGPLLVGGGLFAVIGAVLYLLAVDHDRRGLGPRRGRKGPLLGIRNVFSRQKKTKRGEETKRGDEVKPNVAPQPPEIRPRTAHRRLVLPTIGLVTMLGLSGCAPHYWPDFSEPEQVEIETETEAPVAALAPVPVTQTQIDRMLEDISRIAGEADDTLDPAGLSERFTADALAEREANYKIREVVSDYEVTVPRITPEALGYQLVQSTESWPRTVFVVVASEQAADEEGDEAAAEEEAETGDAAAEAESSPSLALIMTQTAPHENFLVSRIMALRGGITMPEAAPAEEGTALLADDLQSLVMEPAKVGPAYAEILVGGSEVEAAEFFDLEGDSLVERSGAAWVNRSTEAAASAEQGITYSVTAKQSDESIVSLSTGAGGALVATTVLETRTEEPDGGRWRPTVPKSLGALSGLEGQQDKLVSVVAHQLLFSVPGERAGGPIQLLGYTSDLVAANNG